MTHAPVVVVRNIRNAVVSDLIDLKRLKGDAINVFISPPKYALPVAREVFIINDLGDQRVFVTPFLFAPLVKI